MGGEVGGSARRRPGDNIQQHGQAVDMLIIMQQSGADPEQENFTHFLQYHMQSILYKETLAHHHGDLECYVSLEYGEFASLHVSLTCKNIFIFFF